MTYLISRVLHRALKGNYIALAMGPFVKVAYWIFPVGSEGSWVLCLLVFLNSKTFDPVPSEGLCDPRCC